MLTGGKKKKWSFFTHLPSDVIINKPKYPSGLTHKEFIPHLQHVPCKVSKLAGYLSSMQCLRTQAASMWPHHPKGELRKKSCKVKQDFTHLPEVTYT